MAHPRTSVFVLMILSLGCVVTAGCQPETTATDASLQEEAREPAKPLRIVEILAGPAAGDAGMARPTQPADPIVVTLRSDGSTPGADLRVKLIALADGATAGDRSLRLNADSEQEQVIEFRSEAPWQPGRYLVEVTLDGALAGHQEFEVHPADAAEAEAPGEAGEAPEASP